ncbi:MAG: RNA 2'-phosphotransferase [Myxococcales bacterium]|nr:RNA 2'-phosphotransferase [Myxococcales bacterium]
MPPAELSKRLSWLLRHGARASGLAMSAEGWASVDAVCAALGCGRADLDAAVAENTKARFALDGARIRAVQGHSLEGTPVTLDALEASWEPYEAEAWVWHGTALGALDGIHREGITAQARSHVHLAISPDSTVGKRSGVDVLLGVCPKTLGQHGLGLFKSDNGVVLARRVPRDAVVAVKTLTKAARAVEAALCARWERRG